MRSPRSVWIALALAAVCAVGVAFLVLSSPSRRGDVEARTGRERGERARAAELDGLETDAAHPELDARAAAAPSASALDVAPSADDDGIEPVPANGIPVLVLRGRSDEPVPRAVVSVVAESVPGSERRLEELANGTDVAALAKELGRSYRAGADGIARVELPRETVHLSCEDGEQWGWLEVEGDDPGELPLRLRLFDDPPVRVRVLQAPDLVPVPGARVAINYRYGGWSEDLIVQSADERGEVVFRHLRQHSRWYWATTEVLAFAADGAFAEPVEVPFDPDDLPAQVDLVLPERTSVDVRVLDEDGEPARGRLYVELGVIPVGQDEPSGEELGAKLLTDTGHARFEQVGLGLDLLTYVSSSDGRRFGKERFASASTPGESVEVTVRQAGAHPRIVGRLVADGGPLAHVKADGRVWTREADGSASGSWFSLFTDERGRFDVQLHETDWARMTLQARDADDFPCFTEWEPATPLVSGENDLGDVELSRAPLLASGRVLDERLLPIEGARVWATAIDRGRKIDTYGGSTRTRADGTVELFGTTPESQVRVWARHPSYSTGQPAEVAPGSTGFVITLAQAGRIAGSVILPAEWMADFCTVYARPEEWEHEDDDWTDEVEVVRPGYFALDSLDPGTWDLLLAFGAPSQGVDVRGVEVVGGETTRDPRLQELDLRDRVRLFVIEAEDANGKPVEAEVHFRPSEGGEWASESADEGRADLIAFFESLDLFVVGSDNTSAYVTDVREDRRIELAAGHSVRVVWAAEPPVDGTPYGVRVRLELAEDGLPEVAVDVDMGSSNVLPRAGRYRVTYWLVETGKPFFSPLGRASEELIVDTQAQIALSLPQELLDALAERKKE